MELRHLVYFVTVAEERNFTRAAQRLRVVQSGVSAAVRALERDLGARLFERTSQRVTLTDAGAALLPEARATIDAAQAARDAVQEVGGGLRGTLRIGTLISVPFVDLPRLLGRFRADHPAVDLRLRAAPTGSAGLAASLADGELDVAFLSLPGRPPATLSVRTLAEEPIVAVLPVAHPLAQRATLDLADLADEPFVDSPPGYGNRTEVDRAFAAAGLARRVAVEVADIATVKEYIREGLGIALIPRFSVPDEPALRVIPITTALRWTFAVATATTRRPTAAVRALLGLVEEYR
ncbi:LysR family transcriptional regulator [Dactylosporangium matsuzakiense]|uniref:LysR family transcriptional regulator n=1 Tax=Dactylosporangium matsuzakiense TaxID=53360 RepID=A0A9W6NRK0_9ACTN|nr:LysR family transcriptional regulator [Dactylosporangium matsuzakiense]UWZ41700.1 LysR family transcriptional regulator [Dactylosporangium matsuzakiense]GLL07360.1 LysR family transcriptional regulator [Dactylosporangium matsuzakiense]